jgi:hypothetical protein
MGFRSRFVFIVFLCFLVFLSAFLQRIILNLPDFKASPRPKYPAGVPYKFDPDGNVQHFPGNTIISPLSNSTELYSSLMILYNRLKQDPLSDLYRPLPPSSWHMTVFEGSLDEKREPGYWPSNLALNASIEECTALFENELSSFDLQTDLPYHLSIVGFIPLEVGIALHIEPHKADNTALRGLRDRLADLLQIRQPDHKRYGFHLGMAYLLRHLTDDQKSKLTSLLMDHFRDMPKEFELGPPKFCRFENMLAFEPLLVLKNQDS